MSETANLTIKIPLALKEKIKALAESKNTSMSAEIGAMLECSLSEDAALAHGDQVADEIDNQHTEEITEQPFTNGEIKKLRALLNAATKKKSKKK
ncbi:Arc family DNA-binding protein [Martelella alba]|uniref:Arc family DNA-binding protein n=1 Tax=Martelella alba TaxID=2590451 RepID=A0ABY2SMR3_9HYPH|nr:Arc family DNA-binding protein [Martelella alba]TKI06275.1 Arc family DNA-binding protein [Martelella alba]